MINKHDVNPHSPHFVYLHENNIYLLGLWICFEKNWYEFWWSFVSYNNCFILFMTYDKYPDLEIGAGNLYFYKTLFKKGYWMSKGNTKLSPTSLPQDTFKWYIKWWLTEYNKTPLIWSSIEDRFRGGCLHDLHCWKKIILHN